MEEKFLDVGGRPAEYTLLQIRGKHFAKLVGGEVVGMASPGEIETYLYKVSNPAVDPAIIEVAIALAALSGFIAVSTLPWTLKLPALLAFAMTSRASFILFWQYIVTKIPRTANRYLTSNYFKNSKRPHMFWWLVIYRFMPSVRPEASKGVKWHRYSDFQEGTEWGYVSLWYGFSLASVGALWFVISSILLEIMGYS